MVEATRKEVFSGLWLNAGFYSDCLLQTKTLRVLLFKITHCHERILSAKLGRRKHCHLDHLM